jgi:hypothetical protein
MSNSLFTPDDIVYTYTSQQAIEDGIIVDLTETINRYFKNSPINYATTNLLTNGYITLPEESPNGEGKANIPNIIDLVMTASKALRKMPIGDSFTTANLELPNGNRTKIFIAQNETGKFALMLPEDY